MKVVNICRNDYANFSHDNANALRSVGVDCYDYKLAPHPFKYSEQSQIVTNGQLKSLTRDADYIQIMHSDPNLLYHISDRPLIVWHTGTRYRQQHGEINNHFNPRVKRSVFNQPEFGGKGAKNEIYCVGAIDTDKFVPDYYKSGQPIIGHYPSNWDVKGTDTIVEVMDRLKAKYKKLDFRYSKDRVPYDQQLKRLEKCHVYVEMFALLQGGQPYGSWGITTLETAAMGKVVVTNDQFDQIYFNHYKRLPGIIKINTTDELYDEIEGLSKNTKWLKNEQRSARQWVEDYHSYKATGEYILKNILWDT
jgi:hypothetical protein